MPFIITTRRDPLEIPAQFTLNRDLSWIRTAKAIFPLHPSSPLREYFRTDGFNDLTRGTTNPIRQGGDSSIRFGTVADYLVTTGAKNWLDDNNSFSCWLKMHTTPAVPGTVGSPAITHNLGGTRGTYLLVDTNLSIRMRWFGGTITATPANVITLHRWHHVAATVSAAGMKVYVDGKLQATSASTTVSYTYTGILNLGGASPFIDDGGGNQGTRAFYGQLRQVIWSQAGATWSIDQIAQQAAEPSIAYIAYTPRSYFYIPVIHYAFFADAGAFALAGQDALLEESGYGLTAETGSFATTPQHVRLLDSGFVPTEIASLQTWHAANTITGLSDGDLVASWPDGSTHTRTLTQGTAVNQPTYKTGVIKGLPVIRFTNDPDWHGLNYPAMTIGPEFTICGVWKGGGGGLVLDGDGYIRGDRVFHISAQDGQYNFANLEPSPVAYYSVISLHSAGFHYHTCQRAVPESRGRTDSIDATPVTMPGVPTSYFRSLYMGYSDYYYGGYPTPLIGDIAELMFFDSALSLDSVDRIENYLYLKYFSPMPPLTADAGDYQLTGQDAALQRGRILESEETSFAVSGVAAVFPRTIPLDVGSFAFAGQDAAFSSGKGFAHESGTYVFAGQLVTLSKILGLQSEAGEFLLTGQSADIMRSGVFVAGDSTNMSFVISDEPGG